ncbi:MAG: hypothetical protein IAE95_03025 [Chitinophagaceae bacterium]|nr:hypothetical protein [Chitinophagaceae bacterium]
MSDASIRYDEPLNPDNLEVLTQKEANERGQYFKVLRALMVACIVIPLITSWYREYEGAENTFSFVRFFVTSGTLLGICGAATYFSYRAYHSKLLMDLRDRTKTVETNKITRKVAHPSGNAYYFYTDSKTKLSIEVSPEDFNAYNEGDEVSIEFATNSRHYLGYF